MVVKAGAEVAAEVEAGAGADEGITDPAAAKMAESVGDVAEAAVQPGTKTRTGAHITRTAAGDTGAAEATAGAAEEGAEAADATAAEAGRGTSGGMTVVTLVDQADDGVLCRLCPSAGKRRAGLGQRNGCITQTTLCGEVNRA